MRRLVRIFLATFLTLPMAFGWALPVGAGPITATVCLRDSQGIGIAGAEAFVNSGSYLSLGFTDATGSEPEPQPEPEPEAPPVTSPAQPVAAEVGTSTVNDRVIYLALIADRSVGPTSDVPSTGLILGLLWLGPALVILARIRMRRQAE